MSRQPQSIPGRLLASRRRIASAFRTGSLAHKTGCTSVIRNLTAVEMMDWLCKFLLCPNLAFLPVCTWYLRTLNRKTGMTAPSFTLSDRSGKPFSLDDLIADKPVFIEFGSFTWIIYERFWRKEKEASYAIVFYVSLRWIWPQICLHSQVRECHERSSGEVRWCFELDFDQYSGSASKETRSISLRGCQLDVQVFKL